MSLREDLETMERHARRGTLKEWFEGTAPILDVDGFVVEREALRDAEKEKEK